MNKLLILVLGIIVITQSCEQKKEINPKISQELAENNTKTYESALDVPVGKIGVIINIDSLGFFDHNSQNLDADIESKNTKTQLDQLNTDFDVAKIINDKAIKILNENKYDYTIIDKFDQKKLPKDLITETNVGKIDFNELKKSINKDDLVVINVKSGLDYNPENKEKYIAKTYVYINILDLKNNVLKYSETIGGTKYIEQKINNIKTVDLGKMMKESLNETLEIIDKKY